MSTDIFTGGERWASVTILCPRYKLRKQYRLRGPFYLRRPERGQRSLLGRFVKLIVSGDEHVPFVVDVRPDLLDGAFVASPVAIWRKRIRIEVVGIGKILPAEFALWKQNVVDLLFQCCFG